MTKKSKRAEDPDVAASKAFIERIRAEEGNSNEAWWKIAQILLEAAKHYNYIHGWTVSIARQCKIGRSKAVKLVGIAGSPRIHDHIGEFARMPTWTVLYELVALTPEQFQAFLDKHPRDQRITVASVRKASGKARRVEKVKRKVLFQINVDPTDKGYDNFYLSEQYKNLIDALREFSKAFPDFRYAPGSDVPSWTELRDAFNNQVEDVLGMVKAQRMEKAEKRCALANITPASSPTEPETCQESNSDTKPSEEAELATSPETVVVGVSSAVANNVISSTEVTNLSRETGDASPSEEPPLRFRPVNAEAAELEAA